MKTTARYLVICLILMLTTVCTAFAAKTTSTNKAKLGTTQLSGENAQIGTTYTLGKVNPINITVNSIRYMVERVPIGTTVFAPKSGEKLLMITYTLHNPQKRDFGIAWSTLNFTVVDSNNTNRKYVQDVGMDTTHEKGYIALKPAQKAKFYTLITVPAKGEMPKLIIESGDHLVLRYDLRGKVLPLSAPIADPNDKSGATALEEVPAQPNTFYPYGLFDLKLDSIELSDQPIHGRVPKKGNKYLVYKVTAKNCSVNKCGVAWSTFEPTLMDADGAEIKWNSDTLYASRDDNVSMSVESGKEFRFRQYFEVPEDLDLQTLSIKEGGSRAYMFDVSRVQ